MIKYRSYLIYRSALASCQDAALTMYRLYRASPTPERQQALVVTSQLLSEVTRQAPEFPHPQIRGSAIVQVDDRGRIIYRSVGP